jgi:hypothetical protein
MMSHRFDPRPTLAWAEPLIRGSPARAPHSRSPSPATSDGICPCLRAQPNQPRQGFGGAGRWCREPPGSAGPGHLHRPGPGSAASASIRVPAMVCRGGCSQGLRSAPVVSVRRRSAVFGHARLFPADTGALGPGCRRPQGALRLVVGAGDPGPKSGAWGWKPRRAGLPLDGLRAAPRWRHPRPLLGAFARQPATSCR